MATKDEEKAARSDAHDAIEAVTDLVEEGVGLFERKDVEALLEALGNATAAVGRVLRHMDEREGK